MDFNKAKKIGQEIEADFQQLKYTGGYDHNYVTDNYAKGSRRTVAVAYNAVSYTHLDVYKRQIHGLPVCSVHSNTYRRF